MTHDQQGRYYFEHSEYQKAAARFDDPMWRGIALVKAADYENALNAFVLSDSAESFYDQGNALAHLGKYPEAIAAYRQALERRHPWVEAQENLALVQTLLPREDAQKKDDEEQEIPPNLPPDQVKFDEKGKKGSKARVQQLDPKKMADIWLRNIQATPADFLRRRFAIQQTQERPR